MGKALIEFPIKSNGLRTTAVCKKNKLQTIQKLGEILNLERISSQK